MSGKGPYECFACKNNGFPGEMVYLAGKDEQGRAIRQEEDGRPHIHKNKLGSGQQQQVTQQVQPTLSDLLLQIRLIDQKLNKLLDYQNKVKEEQA